MTRRLAAAAAVVGVVICASACKKSTSSSSSTTSPSTTTTDTISGTVAVGSSDVHPFTVGGTTGGEVDVTLTTATPSVPLAISVGTPNGSACTAVAGGTVVAAPGTTAQLSGIMSPATYCVAVFDPGNLRQSVSYTVTVVHP